MMSEQARRARRGLLRGGVGPGGPALPPLTERDETMLTNEEIAKLLDEAKPSIVAGLKADILSQISWEVKHVVAGLVKGHVEGWVKENALPDITRGLVESKQGIVAIGAQLGPEVAKALVAALTDSLKKSLEQSYQRSAMFKALFNL